MVRRLVMVLALALVACDGPPSPPEPGPPWTSITLDEGVDGLPRRRLEAAVTSLGTRLVIAGGYATSLREGLEITDEVLVLDTLAPEPEQQWTQLPPLPVRWTHGALVGTGNTLFLLGGHEDVNGTARGEVFMLELVDDATKREWIPLEPMPVGLERGGAGVVVVPPFVYLLGGANATGPLATNLRFDMIAARDGLVSTLAWSRLLPDLPLARSHPAAMELYGDLFVAGGLDDANRPLGDVWRLSLDDNPVEQKLWRPGEPMITSRGGCAYGRAFGALLCAGGEAGPVAVSVVERYDPDGKVVDGEVLDEWTTLPEMPEPRAGIQGAVIGGKLYVVGGSQSLMFEPTDSVLVFSVVDTIDTPRLGSN